MLWYAFLFVVGALIFVIAAAIYKHQKALATVRFYVAQGMVALPSHKTFFFGDAKKLKEYRKLADELES
jgi:hypothetical protein